MNRRTLLVASFVTAGAGVLQLWHALDAQAVGEAAASGLVGVAALYVAGAVLARRPAALDLVVLVNATGLATWAFLRLPSLVAGSGMVSGRELATLGLLAAAILVVVGAPLLRGSGAVAAAEEQPMVVEAEGQPIDEARRRLIRAGTLGVAGAILTEAALSFLGLGVRIPTATWGNMLYAAQSLDVLQNQWWLWVPPGLAIALAVLAANFVGDGLRDAVDPRMEIG